MPINIQGKQYVTVAERVLAAHENLKDGFSIETELLEANEKYVLFKATVFIGEDNFTGHATSTFSKGGMEAKSPFEIAETSAVGRALGFAGFGVVEGLATANEIHEVQGREEDITVAPKSQEYKDIYSLVVQAKTPVELNSILQNPKFQSLHLEEKRLIQDRIRKAVLLVKPNE